MGVPSGAPYLIRSIMEKSRKLSEESQQIASPKDLTVSKSNSRPGVDHKSLREKHSKIVRGIFRNFETPGGSLSFSFKELPGDQVETYVLYDGELTSLPYGVAKHLNKNCWYPVHAFAQDENGKQVARIGQKIRRFSFESLEFVDLGDIEGSDKSIVTVEHI